METNPTRDLYFQCGQCAGPLVVDAAAAGMTLKCQHCGLPTKVPPAAETAPSPEKEAELKRKLKENESQRTEITGYVNQLNIQLHRWKLRLQTLNDRNSELKAEIDALTDASVP